MPPRDKQYQQPRREYGQAKPSAAASEGRRRLRSRKLLAPILCVGLALAVTPWWNGTAHADAIWDRWQAADAAVAKGDPGAAVPHWKFLVEHYASKGDWESAALFSGRLNEYFDHTKDYEQAIRYYELENEYWLKFGKDWGAEDLQRAEQIRTTVELYMTVNDTEALRKRSAPASGPLSKYEPEYGTYIGLYSERDPKMQNYFDRSEQFYGKKHALYLAYSPVNATFPKAYATRAKQAGSALQIAWEPSDGLEAVTESVVRSWAKGAKEAGIPIFLRYASEMNGDWVVWHGDPQLYIEKFRMVHDVMAQEAPNVAMVWSPADVPIYKMDAYYPGDDYVDWVGVSLYTEPYENGDPQQANMQATSPIERLDYLYDKFAERKPIMLSESGVSHYANLPDESFGDYGLLNMQRLYEIMPAKYPRLKSITYFNVNLAMTESKNNYSLRDNETIYKLYKQMIASPFYLNKVENGAKPADARGNVPADGKYAFTRNTELTPFVKIPDIYIGKLEYYLNGKLIDTQSSPPFGIDLKAGDVPDHSEIELAVYNKQGSKVAAQSFPIESHIAVMLNGKELAFEQPPVLREGNTLTPIRAIFEAVGATVKWDAATRTATAQKGNTTVAVQIGSNTALRNNVPVPLEVPAQLIGGSTMVPARFAAEAFGGAVGWDGETRTVQIRTDGKAVAQLSEPAVWSTGAVTAIGEGSEPQMGSRLVAWVKLQLTKVAKWWGAFA
ncbi:hypothetical protein PAESOLCIP111_00887 [Paenibacillus solanacearum]|uniref:GH26 domain-containing protein n=1 Tax=Paenibacillus solanacearum TaxID=2048548 RepID=A0A916JV12_9BACL|nr:stalk domain-containing protein [Paenibacillus solanacearum]CAG7606157.1 hypothetical protein PAESOLCIP111_00887 [Paenibacillus solanacearum]